MASRTSDVAPTDRLEERDADAERRDRAARERDRAAKARDRAVAEFEAAGQQRDEYAQMNGTDALTRAASERRHAAQRRAQTALQREAAARDREQAEADRRQAALERRAAFVERERLMGELRREQARVAQAQHHQRRAELLARTLQRSLSPPRLPRLARLDVAVHYEPSAPEDVGGDFYDLFPLSSGRSGFFLGDVCGKGPEAAAVTSLARYTMRTAAMLHETPEEVVMDLNAALLMEATESIQTCTAVYGEIDVREDAAAITLAVAGHPPPLIVRAHGAVEQTAAYGTMLGVVAQPTFQTCEVSLSAGDAIVLCSDGLQDAEIDGERIDERRVADLLAGPPAASARMLVRRLTDALGETARPLRDDVAIMVLQMTHPQPA